MAVEVIGAAFAFALGWMILRLLPPVTGNTLLAIAAFPIGTAVWVVASVALIVTTATFNPAAGWLLAASILVVCNLIRKARPTRDELMVLAASGASLLAIVWVLARFEWSIFNSDALWTFYMADELIDHGFFSFAVRSGQLTYEPIYLPLVSAYARWAGEPYFVSLSSLMLLGSGALFAVLGMRVARPSEKARPDYRMWVPVLGAIALLTTGFYVNGLLQVKTHGVYALHMLGACAALYFAAREARLAWFYLAMLFTAPLILVRLEAAVTALPILVVAVAISAIPLRTRLLSVGSIATAWGLSFLYLLGATTYRSGTFDRTILSKKLFLIGVTPGLVGAAILLFAVIERNDRHRKWLNRIVSWLPAAMVATLSAILMAHWIIYPAVMRTSLDGLATIFAAPDMGAIGLGVTLVVVLPATLILCPRVPWAWTVWIPAYSYLVFLMLADIHLEGLPHWGPTGALTRIANHVLPTLLFYAVLRMVMSLSAHPRPAGPT